MRPELIARFPGLHPVPWVRLGTFPTPVQRMERLGAHLGLTHLYVKRDDLSSPRYGGNKVRKLEFVLADALRRGCDRIVTFGALGSNHVLATTIHGRSLGLSTTGILVPQPVQEYLRRNVLAGRAQGLELEYVASRPALAGRAVSTYLRHRLAGRRPYLLWMGGSSTLGVLGYVEAALEIASQVQAGLLPEPAYAFVPAGTGGTMAGLLLGLRLARLRTVPVAVRVLERALVNEHVVAYLARRTHRCLSRIDPALPDVRLEAGDVLMLHDHAGSEYARFTREGLEAVDLARDLEGLGLEGTYSGKAMAGMMAFARSSIQRHVPVLFIDTHNSAPLEPLMEGADPGSLPPPVRAYLDGPVAEVEE